MQAIAIVLLALFVAQQVLYWRREEKLLNRLMARDYKEFQYFEEKYPKDVAEVEKLREEARDERKKLDDEQELAEAAIDNLGDPDDWKE
jgi:hypothetical protein